MIRCGKRCKMSINEIIALVGAVVSTGVILWFLKSLNDAMNCKRKTK
jgi:hypothetical protein